MTKQPTLFDPPQEAWINRIWRALDPSTREKVISVLAQMGRGAIASRLPEDRVVEGSRHEP